MFTKAHHPPGVGWGAVCSRATVSLGRQDKVRAKGLMGSFEDRDPILAIFVAQHPAQCPVHADAQ